MQNTSDTAATWQVNGVTRGSTSTGTISKSGVFTAPATVPSSATAVAQADTSKSASATVTITASAAGTGASFYVSTGGKAASREAGARSIELR
jgi:hypothetical protein